MSKLKLWKPFSLFMALLLMSSLAAVVPARPVQANVSRPPTEIDEGGIFGPAQLSVPLGSAAAFAVLAGSTVTNTGATTVNGDLGVSPGTAVTGFPPGNVNGKTYTGVGSAAGQAKLDLTTAYNDAAGRTLAPVTVAGNIGGQTLYPGLYKSTSSLAISSGELTLDAQGDANAVWIFQIASTLTTTSGRQVILSGGANAANIFWQVGTSATIGTTSVFQGNILADQSITITNGATLNGRALARVGAVTLDHNIVTIPSIPTIILPTPPIGSMTVNPYDTRIIGLNTGYRITMTAGASLNAGDTITITFPTNTDVSAVSATPGNVFVKGIPCAIVAVAGREVTVTAPATMSPIVPGQQFTVTFNKASGILNPTTSGFYNVTVWTNKEPIPVTSSLYEITAVKVYTGTIKQSESATIQAAIDAAISGDTITVPAGTYLENLTVNKRLTLQGASSATTIVTAAYVSDHVFDVTATSGVIISGFTATGATGTGAGAYAGINLQASNRNCNIHDNILTGNEYGILLIEPAGPPLTTVPGNNTFTSNTASGNSVSGIEMQNTYGNTFTNNIANSNGSQGFKLAAARSNTFTGNTANLNGTPGTGSRCGFYLVATNGGCNDNIFTNNTANSNIERDGFRLRGSNHNTFMNNTASSNGRAGIRLDFNCDNTVLTGNNFTSNTQYGIQIDDDGSTPVIDATTLTVSGNNIAGNTLFGINYDNSGGALNAKHNYWGNASGPSHDIPVPVTFGNKVSTGVVFSPWLVAAYSGTPPAGEITISTASPLPDGSTGVAYSKTFSATGGSGPYTWALYSGSLPDGLSILGSNLTGTPTVVNTFTFALQVKDGIQATYHDFAMQVYGGNLVVTTTSPLPNGTKNVPYGPVQLQATGGTGSYIWSLDVGSGPLPTGLGLASDGKITGTPTAGGPFNFRVKVACDILTPGTKDLSITISAPLGAGQKLIGADDTACSGAAGAGYLCMCRFQPTQSGNMTQFRLKASAPGNVKVAVYTDISGSPGALISAVNTSTPVVAGWNTITFPSTALATSSYYWLAFNSETSLVCYNSSAGSFSYKALPFASELPASAGTGFTSSPVLGLLAGWSAAVPPTAPTVTNSTGESVVTQISARLNGEVTATGSENPTVVIYWGPTDGGTTYTNWANSVNKGTQSGTFSTDITGLIAGTDYWYRCFAANSGGSDWADSSEPFHTLALGAPTVNNSAASSVTATSARLNGVVTGTGGQDPTVTIYWGDNDGTTNSYAWDNSVNLGTKGAVTFFTDITDLTRSTKYYYQCFASSTSGSAWAGSSENFTTLSGDVEQKFIGADDAVAGGPAGAGYLMMDRFAAVASGTVSQIRVKCTNAGSVKVALYTDNGGSPGTLITANNTGASVIAGWNNISLSTPVTTGIYYWIAYNSSPACVGYTASAGGAILYRAFSYSADFPASAGSGFATSSGYHSLVAGWGGGVVLALPGSPTLVTPKATITFEWSAISEATKYRLQVNTASDFTGTVMFDNSAISTTSQQVTLPVGSTYYWRVKAGNAGGWSGWSSTGSVTP